MDKPFDDPFQHICTFFILASHSGDGGTVLSAVGLPVEVSYREDVFCALREEN